MDGVANKNRPEEDEAADVIAACLAVDRPINTDVNGEVDLGFNTADGHSAAVEVTTLTNAKVKSAASAWVKQRERNNDTPSLNHSWTVAVPTKNVQYPGLAKRLEPHLSVLEKNGIEHIDDMIIARMPLGEGREAALAVVAERVLDARVFHTKDPAVRRIFYTPVGSWVSRGADDALSIIEQYLAECADNQRKLAKAGADQSHLFLWLDSDTDGAVAATFTALEERNGQLIELPSRPPTLPEPITDLWVVHRRTRRGWIYNSVNGWRTLRQHADHGPLGSPDGER